ncbi:hypothetical protein TNCV_1383681 [Trichonephila clavipes]|nr:hypothetical protein TNCV_1383681 [Trichonephila clavipes]
MPYLAKKLSLQNAPGIWRMVSRSACGGRKTLAHPNQWLAAQIIGGKTACHRHLKIYEVGVSANSEQPDSSLEVHAQRTVPLQSIAHEKNMVNDVMAHMMVSSTFLCSKT